ncbi:uncharacterized protein PHACADRAFT_184121 [Phanerochaete carnosa HHB-10118-sp]|uniref:Uncharacterized protein n=1 Tax=Phanerochaete carnosa (strain HHB-10118-sp) TaxID=650164 RepID=K5W844_PHACS|nr:uncharacterized protein PHACADRAFT_184121 [Phanerochaete carnosa HHB-10118-sp]EKM55310.1 hypothetical protein PHACADRAFT_184121 [Phanerochaete carnosa HHB-10118-sp]
MTHPRYSKPKSLAGLGRSVSAPLIGGPQLEPMQTLAWKVTSSYSSDTTFCKRADNERTPKLGLPEIVEEGDTEDELEQTSGASETTGSRFMSQPVTNAAADETQAASVAQEAERSHETSSSTASTPDEAVAPEATGTEIDASDTSSQWTFETASEGYMGDDDRGIEASNAETDIEDEGEPAFCEATLPRGFLPAMCYAGGISGWQCAESDNCTEVFLVHATDKNRRRLLTPVEAEKMGLLNPWIPAQDLETCLQALRESGAIDPAPNSVDMASLSNVRIKLSWPMSTRGRAQTPSPSPPPPMHDLPSSSLYMPLSPSLSRNSTSLLGFWLETPTSPHNVMPDGYHSGSAGSSSGRQPNMAAHSWLPPVGPSSSLSSSPHYHLRLNLSLSSHRYRPYPSSHSTAAPSASVHPMSDLLLNRPTSTLGNVPAQAFFPAGYRTAIDNGVPAFFDSSAGITILCNITAAPHEAMNSMRIPSALPTVHYGDVTAYSDYAQGSSTLLLGSSILPTANLPTSDYHAHEPFQTEPSYATPHSSGDLGMTSVYSAFSGRGLTQNHQDLGLLDNLTSELTEEPTPAQFFVSDAMPMQGHYLDDFVYTNFYSMPTYDQYPQGGYQIEVRVLPLEPCDTPGLTIGVIGRSRYLIALSRTCRFCSNESASLCTFNSTQPSRSNIAD